MIELSLGNIAAAETLNKEVLPFLRIDPDHPYLVMLLASLAGVACASKQFVRAARLLSAAKACDTDWVRESADFNSALNTTRAELGDIAFGEAWETGSIMTREATITYALQDVPAPEIPTDVSQPDTSSRYHNPPLSFSARELEILRLIADGYTNAEIAARLVLATSTVKWYVHAILVKLNVTSRTQAVTSARNLGLLI